MVFHARTLLCEVHISFARGSIPGSGHLQADTDCKLLIVDLYFLISTFCRFFLSVAVPVPQLSTSRSSSTAVSAGYVPDGLTEKEYEDMKKNKAQKAAARKKEVKDKKFEVSTTAFALSVLVDSLKSSIIL